MKAQWLLESDGTLHDRRGAAWVLNRWRRLQTYRREGEPKDPRPILTPFSPSPKSETAKRALALMESGWTGGECIKLVSNGRGLKVTLVDGVPVHVTESRNGEPWTLFEATLSAKGREVFGGAARYEFSHCGGAAARKGARAILEAFFQGDNPAQALSHLSNGTNCCCCGRALTDPDSIKRGIGPECIRKVYAGDMLRLAGLVGV